MASKKRGSRGPEDDSVNGRLQDRAIRHAIYLERYNATVTQDVVGFLNDEVYPDLLAKLEARLARIKLRGSDTGFEATKRYLRMLDDLRTLLAEGHDEARKRLVQIAKELAKVEARWQEGVVASTVPKDAHAYVLPDQAVNLRIVQQVVSQPIQGKVMEDWWEDLTQDTQRRLHNQIGIGLAQGETTDQIVRRVRGTQAAGYRDGVLEATRSQVAAVVRTTTAHVTTQAREQTYREMSDVLDGVQWVATLDTRTCQVCGPLDGQKFKVGEGPRPPAHWNCRCTTTPVTKSLASILGRRKRAGAPEPSPSTRASMDGQVPETVTYDDWIARQPAAVQDEVFGPARGRLYRSGEITAKDMVTRTGRLRTLDELRDS